MKETTQTRRKQLEERVRIHGPMDPLFEKFKYENRKIQPKRVRIQWVHDTVMAGVEGRKQGRNDFLRSARAHGYWYVNTKREAEKALIAELLEY